uniref:Uncharacterized protein n=1 Tax=Parascaris univalens TaxID=6257 RepID=A0A915C7D1_PARUN
MDRCSRSAIFLSAQMKMIGIIRLLLWTASEIGTRRNFSANCRRRRENFGCITRTGDILMGQRKSGILDR